MKDCIIQFIKKQTCASICCVDKNGSPYCFSCFYAFNSDEGLLYFKSSPGSRHSEIISENPGIAGTILPDKLNILLVKGIQFEGVVLPENDFLCKNASVNYHKKYPVALAMQGETLTIQINSIKMTDSSMGFGKKIIWVRKEEVVNAL
jgi:uncharacterized protein YhbP (UPF0306 family)